MTKLYVTLFSRLTMKTAPIAETAAVLIKRYKVWVSRLDNEAISGLAACLRIVRIVIIIAKLTAPIPTTKAKTCCNIESDSTLNATEPNNPSVKMGSSKAGKKAATKSVIRATLPIIAKGLSFFCQEDG